MAPSRTTSAPFLKRKERYDRYGHRKGRILTHRKALCAFKVGGGPGQEMRCFVDPSWFFVFQDLDIDDPKKSCPMVGSATWIPGLILVKDVLGEG